MWVIECVQGIDKGTVPLRSNYERKIDFSPDTIDFEKGSQALKFHNNRLLMFTDNYQLLIILNLFNFYADFTGIRKFKRNGKKLVKKE